MKMFCCLTSSKTNTWNKWDCLTLHKVNKTIWKLYFFFFFASSLATIIKCKRIEKKRCLFVLHITRKPKFLGIWLVVTFLPLEIEMRIKSKSFTCCALENTHWLNVCKSYTMATMCSESFYYWNNTKMVKTFQNILDRPIKKKKTF